MHAPSEILNTGMRFLVEMTIIFPGISTLVSDEILRQALHFFFISKQMQTFVFFFKIDCQFWLLWEK
jgi:hypothetical protein